MPPKRFDQPLAMSAADGEVLGARVISDEGDCRHAGGSDDGWDQMGCTLDGRFEGFVMLDVVAMLDGIKLHAGAQWIG